MQIEHISGSYRRQTRNRKMWWCVTAVNRMLQPTKSPWSANPECVTTVLQSATESTQVNSKKSTLSRKVNARQQAKSQRSSSLVNPLTSISVPNSTAFQNRTSQQFSALSDHALTKVNAGQTSSKTLAAEIRPSAQPYRFVLLLHTCGLNSSSKELVLNQMREEDVS